MLNHYTIYLENEIVPFVIVSQVEVPLGYPNPGLYRHLELRNEGACCPDCGTLSTSIHEYHPKVIIGGTHNGTPIYDSFLHRRFVCKNCPRTFMERLPWLGEHQRMAEPARRAMFHAIAESTFKAVGKISDAPGRISRSMPASISINVGNMTLASSQPPSFWESMRSAWQRGKAATVL